MLSVSRVPVREAVKRLEAEGLVVVVPRSGVYMRALQPDDVRQLYEVRQALEGMAAFLCATGNRKDEIKSLRKELESLRAKKASHSVIQRQSRVFHAALFDLCDNAQLQSLYRTVESQIEMNLRLTAVHAPERIDAVLSEHYEIAKAIEAGDPTEAERLMRLHLENGKRTRIRVLADLEATRTDEQGSPRPKKNRQLAHA
jgi:DNA-binding GntR family transcriptional regulator